MAEKEATVLIVDVGRSMSERRHGRSRTDLEWAMLYVWDKLTSTIALDRKTTLQAVIGLKTQGTANELEDDPSFRHITVFKELKQLLLQDVKDLDHDLVSNDTDNGDAISALVVAITLIENKCKKLQYKRRIILITNGHGALDTDQIDEITKKIVSEGIELIVLGVDFDDVEYGFKEEDKDSRKAANEDTLRSITDATDGIFGTLAQAIDELGVPRLKQTRPIASYKEALTLGSPEQFDTALSISVERYPRTMIRHPPSASSYVQSAVNGGSTGTQSMELDPQPNGESASSNPLTSVRFARNYQVDDPSAPNGLREVAQEDLSKGYEYGRTAVHVSEADMHITKLETKASLELVGFIPWDNFERYMCLSTSNIIIANRTNTKAIMALSSLIHALSELESFAVARLVTKEDRPPLMVILAPSIEPDYECLIDVQLPFAEDVRPYKFPPLDKVVTVSGKVLKEHRLLPNDDLQSAMSDYVDSMDLMDFGQDEQGQPAEYMQMMDMYSPVLHRMDQAVRWRAAHPQDPIPPPYESLIRFSHPPDALVESSQSQLKKLKAAANVKKVPPKARGRRQDRPTARPLSGLDVKAILQSSGDASGPTATNGVAKGSPPFKLSADNAIPDFKRQLELSSDANVLDHAGKQLGEIITNRVRDSFGDMHFDRVIEEMGTFRSEMLDLEAPEVWNEWLQRFKVELLQGDLGGDRSDLWWRIRRLRMGLITAREEERSAVTEDEARQFLVEK